MINYEEISFLLSQRLICPPGFFSFEQGTVQLIFDLIDKKIPIQSGRIILTEEKFEFLIWHEVEELPYDADGKTIKEKANSILNNHCFGLKFEFGQKNKRQFFGLSLKILMPHPQIEMTALDTYTAKNIMGDFLDDCVGYAPLWMEKTESLKYTSRCIVSSDDKGRCLYPNFESKLKNFLNGPLDDFSGIENLI